MGSIRARSGGKRLGSWFTARIPKKAGSGFTFEVYLVIKSHHPSATLFIPESKVTQLHHCISSKGRAFPCNRGAQFQRKWKGPSTCCPSPPSLSSHCLPAYEDEASASFLGSCTLQYFPLYCIPESHNIVSKWVFISLHFVNSQFVHSSHSATIICSFLFFFKPKRLHRSQGC